MDATPCQREVLAEVCQAWLSREIELRQIGRGKITPKAQRRAEELIEEQRHLEAQRQALEAQKWLF